MVATLERAVRAHPTQWFNFFDVWSPPRGRAVSGWRWSPPAWPRPSARTSTRSGPRCSPAPAGSRPSSAFPVADLRVGRGGEIKKLTRVSAGAACRTAAPRACSCRPPTSSPRRCRCGRADVDPARVAVVVGTALGGVEEGERALAGERGRAPAARRPLRRARTQPRPLARRARARAHRVHRLRVGRHRARRRRRPAAPGHGRPRGGGRLRHPLPLRDARLRRPALADARRGAPLRPPPQRAAPRRGGRARAAGARGGRGARRLGSLLGHASTGDGSHIAAPEPDGRGLERAVRGRRSPRRASRPRTSTS